MTQLHDAQQDRRIDYVELAATSIADVKRFYKEAQVGHGQIPRR